MDHIHETRYTKAIRYELEVALDDLRSSTENPSGFAFGEVMGLSRALRLLQKLDNNSAMAELRNKLINSVQEAKGKFDRE